MKGRKKRQPKSSRTRSTKPLHGNKTKKGLLIGTVATGIFVATIATPLGSLLANGLGLSEPNLVHIGGPPKTPSLEIKGATTAGHVLHVTVGAVFKNWSFTRGHVAKVTVAVDGSNVAPKAVEIISLDKTELGWFQEKEVRCELLVTVDPTTIITPQPSTLRFRIYFYGPKGNQLYMEGIEVEGRRQAA